MAAAVLSPRSKSRATDIDDCRCNDFLLIHKSAHQAVLAKQIDHARNAIANNGESPSGFGIENLLAIRSRNPQALLRCKTWFPRAVSACVLARSVSRCRNCRNCGCFSLLFQFRLSHQHDLQQASR